MPPGASKFPAQFARASLKVGVNIQQDIILLQFPAQFARASLKAHQVQVLEGPAHQFPAQFARASLKDGAIGRQATAA